MQSSITPRQEPGVPVAYVTLRESATPVTAPVTKFGGQPVWLDAPRWPLSATDGKPMRFVAQVALDPRLFGGATEARMAYVFLAEDDPQLWTKDGKYAGVDGAVVLQPGGATGYAHALMERGPTLDRLVERRSGFLGLRRQHERVPCEYTVELDYATEPELRLVDVSSEDYDEDIADTMNDERVTRTKVGGTPAFIQDVEFPFDPPCTLVLQIADDDSRFALPLSDVGSLYAFMDPRGVRGGLIIQSH